MTAWQSITWNCFHTIALNYREEYKEYYNTFFDTFKTIIPCKICRNHFIQNINKPNMSIDENNNSEKIFNWTIDLHNSVNRMHSKKIWSHEEAKNYYRNNNFNNNVFKFFIFEYIRSNFKKKPEKTQQLIRMMNTLPYLHPDEKKRNQLIHFKEQFELNRNTMKNWLLAFILILKN